MKFTDGEVDTLARCIVRMIMEFDMCVALPKNLAEPTQKYLASTMYTMFIMAEALSLTDKTLEIVRAKAPDMYQRVIKLFESFAKIHRKNEEEAKSEDTLTIEQSTIDAISRIANLK